MKPGNPLPNGRITLCLILATSLANMTPTRAQSPDIQGIVTRLTIERTDAQKIHLEPLGEERRPRPLVLGDLIRRHDRIRVPAGAEVGLMCSSDRWIRIKGNTTWTLSRSACSSGQEVDPGTFMSLSPPRTGRWLQSDDGSIVLESAIRGAGSNDLLLSPRATKVRNPRPVIQWLDVPSAVEYELKIRGALPHRVGRKDLTCNPDPVWFNERVCSLPWPDTHPGLTSDRAVSIEVAYREGIASPLIRQTGSPSRIELLSEDKKRSLSSKLLSLGTMTDGLQLAVLEGKLFVEDGLYSSAIESFRHALELGASPPVQVTLGDLYAVIGLSDLARRTYQEAAETGDDPAVEASVSMGLGRLEATAKSFPQASLLFERARDLYKQLGLDELAEIAEQAAAESARRISTH